MNILQIQYFITLAEELSFSKAAEKLYVTQPNVSMQISSLEKEWGIQLFFRKYRSVQLTPSGRIMYKTIKEASSLFEAGLEKARQNKDNTTVPVIFGVPEYCNLGIFPEVLAVFQKDHPEVRLVVESNPEAQLTLTAANGRFDLVLNQRFMLENIDELNTCRFSNPHFTIIISKDHPLVKAHPDFEPSLLAGEKIAAYIPVSGNSARLVEHCSHICKSCGFTPEEVILTPNVNSALIAAKMGFGITVLDETVLIPHNSNLISFNSSVVTEMILAWRKDNEKGCLADIVDLLCEKMDLPLA